MKDTNFHGFIVNLKIGMGSGFKLFEDDFSEFSGKGDVLMSFLISFQVHLCRD